MKRFGIKNSWIVIAFATCCVLSAIMFVSPSSMRSSMVVTILLPCTVILAVLLMFPSGYILFVGASEQNTKREDFVHSPFAKIVSILVIAAIAINTTAVIKSLWYNPMDENYSDRFDYEVIATVAGITTIILILLLSSMQKDIYWFTRKKTVALDERQLQERRAVFETSYKLGAVLIFISTNWLNNSIHNVPEIFANNYGKAPSHLGWIVWNFAFTLFALPLIVAAWKKRSIPKL